MGDAEESLGLAKVSRLSVSSHVREEPAHPWCVCSVPSFVHERDSPLKPALSSSWPPGSCISAKIVKSLFEFPTFGGAFYFHISY